jgi:transcriptional antiterminator RfaH
MSANMVCLGWSITPKMAVACNQRCLTKIGRTVMTASDFWEQSNWYAVQTKPGREEQAASNISRLGLDVFLPRIKRRKLNLGRSQTHIKPLFPGYLFAHFSPLPYLHSIRYARGVNRVVCAGDMPIPLGTEIISAIKSKVGKDVFVSLGPGPFMTGDRVIINDGPLQGLSGVFERELSGRERAVVLLKTVDYQARVFIEKWRLKSGTAIH